MSVSMMSGQYRASQRVIGRQQARLIQWLFTALAPQLNIYFSAKTTCKQSFLVVLTPMRYKFADF